MLQLKLTTKAGVATVALKGALKEGIGETLAKTTPRLAREHVVFDLGDLKAINSIGFRAWIDFLNGPEAPSTFDLIRCPQVYLDYAGLLPKTSFASRIASVLVPYACTSCRKEATETFDVDALDEGEEFGVLACTWCNGVASPQVSASECFAFRRLE